MKSRYIKQDLDKKGRIKKSSRVVFKKEILDTDFYRKLGHDMKIVGEGIDNLKLNLAIRNLIIVILIVLLIMWR